MAGRFRKQLYNLTDAAAVQVVAKIISQRYYIRGSAEKSYFQGCIFSRFSLIFLFFPLFPPFFPIFSLFPISLYFSPEEGGKGKKWEKSIRKRTLFIPLAWKELFSSQIEYLRNLHEVRTLVLWILTKLLIFQLCI